MGAGERDVGLSWGSDQNEDQMGKESGLRIKKSGPSPCDWPVGPGVGSGSDLITWAGWFEFRRGAGSVPASPWEKISITPQVDTRGVMIEGAPTGGLSCIFPFFFFTSPILCTINFLQKK
jgi:hypothetical protein